LLKELIAPEDSNGKGMLGERGNDAVSKTKTAIRYGEMRKGGEV
jgi:hypothetical protein